MKLTLSKAALIACIATSAFAATSANAAQHRTDGCQFAFFESCGIVAESSTANIVFMGFSPVL